MKPDPNYPRMMFHPSLDPVTVHSKEEELALGLEWSRRIWVAPPPHVEPPQAQPEELEEPPRALPEPSRESHHAEPAHKKRGRPHGAKTHPKTAERKGR